MARIPKDHPLYGASGRVGDLVLRTTKEGNTFASYLPKGKKLTAPRSEKQQAQNRRLAEASAYAVRETEDATGLDYYEKYINGTTSPYNAAVRDYFNCPEIDLISNKAIQSGWRVTVDISDDTAVSECYAQCEGKVYRPKRRGDRYTFTLPAEAEEVTVCAKDRPGNEARLVVVAAWLCKTEPS